MRDIKFRARVLNSKNWIYRQPFHIRGTWYMYNSLWEMVPIEHKTIGQYTGLKDKNGKEIYEGDIVEQKTLINGYICQGEVIFENGKYLVDVKKAKFARDGFKSDFDLKIREYTVLGNIYEHNHLLEGENS